MSGDDQQSFYERQFHRFNKQIWLATAVPTVLMLIEGIVLYSFVQSARCHDLEEIKKAISAVEEKCGDWAENAPKQIHDQQVIVGQSPTLTDLARDVLISRGEINGNVRRTVSPTGGQNGRSSGSGSNRVSGSSSSDSGSSSPVHSDNGANGDHDSNDEPKLPNVKPGM